MLTFFEVASPSESELLLEAAFLAADLAAGVVGLAGVFLTGASSSESELLLEAAFLVADLAAGVTSLAGA